MVHSIGPLTFLAEEAPVYRTAKIIIIACLCGAALALVSIFAVHWIWNRRRDAEAARTGSATGEKAGEEEDLTDFQDRAYRYVL